jgi:hypothetical protein
MGLDNEFSKERISQLDPFMRPHLIGGYVNPDIYTNLTECNFTQRMETLKSDVQNFVFIRLPYFLGYLGNLVR